MEVWARGVKHEKLGWSPSFLLSPWVQVVHADVSRCFGSFGAFFVRLIASQPWTNQSSAPATAEAFCLERLAVMPGMVCM